MEKIKSFKDRFEFLKFSKKKKQSKLESGSGKFSRTVEAVFSNRTVDPDDEAGPDFSSLEALLDEVCETGEKLKQTPTFENIKSYKKAVKGFLNYLVNNMLDLEEHISGANILKRKRFMIINVIDQKLESLAIEILSNQHQQMNILSKIDEINGLLVDLLR